MTKILALHKYGFDIFWKLKNISRSSSTRPPPTTYPSLNKTSHYLKPSNTYLIFILLLKNRIQRYVVRYNTRKTRKEQKLQETQPINVHYVPTFQTPQPAFQELIGKQQPIGPLGQSDGALYVLTFQKSQPAFQEQIDKKQPTGPSGTSDGTQNWLTIKT